jgi:FlaA1/EpsC-like NDP-sugar epimerase
MLNLKSDFFDKVNFTSDFKKLDNLIPSGMKIMVIGGAGTIGSNYIKQFLKFKPNKIVVVDINENGLTELTRDLRSSNLLDYNPEYITYPVNLLSDTFDKILFSDNFDVIANFSAHKHVRSEKDKISVEALNCFNYALKFHQNIFLVFLLIRLLIQ